MGQKFTSFSEKVRSHLVSKEILAHEMFWGQKASLACVSTQREV